MPNIRYEQLSDEERGALFGALTVNAVSGRAHIEAAIPGLSKSTYYKYYRDGTQSIIKKGILDTSGNVTRLGIDILSLDLLREIVNQLRKEIECFTKELSESNCEKAKHEFEIIKLNQQVNNLSVDIEKAKSLKSMLASFQKLKIDENWVRASVALNLVEPAIKMKLEQLGVEIIAQPKFHEIYDLLNKALKDKENRELKSQLLSPKTFWEMRCNIDHSGHKFFSLTAHQADFIVNAITEFIDDLFS